MDVADVIVTVIGVVLALTVGIVALPIAAVVLLVRWIWRKAHGDKALPPSGKQAYAYLEDGASQDAIMHVVSGYVDDVVLGPYAQGVLATFDTAELRHRGIFSILEDEFTRDSLTWDKFSVPVDVAIEGILHNATQLANRIQAFDSKEYQRMGRIERAGGYDEGRSEVKRLGVMRETLKEMDQIQTANDQLLAELENLQAKLASMSGADVGKETDQIIEEIRQLAEDAKYYA